jgi:hypothetical protein
MPTTPAAKISGGHQCRIPGARRAPRLQHVHGLPEIAHLGSQPAHAPLVLVFHSTGDAPAHLLEDTAVIARLRSVRHLARAARSRTPVVPAQQARANTPHQGTTRPRTTPPSEVDGAVAQRLDKAITDAVAQASIPGAIVGLWAPAAVM